MGSVELVLRLPGWVAGFLAGQSDVLGEIDARMGLAIELAEQNVAEKTGGPFGAAILERLSGRLISVGVNVVTGQNCSVGHAEIMAIGLAQQQLGSYDLSSVGGGDYELVTSVEPCAMCVGAVCWSGVRSLVCGARGEDAERIGFDEGPKVGDWVGMLKRRGIDVRQDVRRERAQAALNGYVEGGGVIYNGRGGR